MMKKFVHILLLAVLVVSCRESGDDVVRPTKNVILMIPDGASSGVLSLSRWYRRYLGDSDFELNLSEHLCGMMSSTMSDGIISDSAPAMSAIVTGMPQRSGNISVYPTPHPGQDIIEVDPEKAHQPLVTLLEAVRLDRKAATGVVVTVAYHHATPAACASHAPSRKDTLAIAHQMASSGLDLVFASKGKMMDDSIREILSDSGVTLLEDDLKAFRNYNGGRPLWALFGEDLMDYDLDRDTAKVPSLAEMTARAIDILSKDKDGFFLVVEGSKVDYAAHANDPNAVITEFLAFDQAVGVAMDYARKNGNTTVVVVPDHGNAGITGGNKGYRKPSRKGVDSIYVRMNEYKATYYKLEKLLSSCRKDEIRSIFKQWTGIDLTDKEFEQLVSLSGVRESDYMKVAHTRNFQSVISSILMSRTHIGFASSSHTAEDVFLAAYHPKGDVPHGLVTNVELNDYLCKAAGLKKSLPELTREYFVSHDSLFEGLEYETSLQDGIPTLTVHTASGDLTVPAWRNFFIRNGKKYRLPVATVHIRENETFYLPRQILSNVLNKN